MNTGETWGLVGGIAGGLIGLLGGIVGAHFSLKNIDSKRERAFVIRWCLACVLAVSVYCALRLTLPDLYRHFLWIPYSILLPWGIVAGNRKLQRIREMESRNNPAQPKADKAPI